MNLVGRVGVNSHVNGTYRRTSACVNARLVYPSPATHAILAQLKAGETVSQTGELPETLRVPKLHYEPPQTVCKIPLPRFSRLQWKMVTGLGLPEGQRRRLRPVRAGSSRSPGRVSIGGRLIYR